MSLTIEELKFLKKISNNNIKITDLAKLNNMSTRNIRYKIDNLNFYLNKYIDKKIEVENGVAKLNILKDDEQKLFKLIDESILKFTKEERQEIIINMYLFKKNVTLAKIEEILNVTRITINKDIKDINKKIENRDIRLDIEGKRIALVGNEKKLRHYKTEYLLKYINIEEKKFEMLYDELPGIKLIQHMIEEYLLSLPMEKIIPCINNTQELLEAKFGNIFNEIIFLYLGVTVERIGKGHIIRQKNNKDFLKTLKQYRVLKETLKDIIPIDYSYELLHLTEYFIGGYTSQEFTKSEFLVNKFGVNILEDLENKLNIVLKEKDVLIGSIVKYLNPAIYRIKNNFTVDKILDFNTIDEGIYEIVSKTCKKNNYLLPELLREEEILYISNVIGRAIDNEKTKVVKLSELIDMIVKNSKELDIENIKKDLLSKFGHLLIEDV